MKLNFRKLGNGSPLIILHGMFGSSDNWQTSGKKFAGNNFSVYLVDLRNHGHSFHSSRHNYDVMSKDVFELINSENLLPAPAIIGHSMGGKVAMQLALNYPGTISKLIVVDIAPKKYFSLNDTISEALLSVDLEKIKTRKEVENVLSKKINDPASLQLLLKGLYWKKANQPGWRFNAEAIHANMENMNAAIISENAFINPALFIRSSKSNYISEEDMPGIKKYFPESEIRTAPSAGHWVHTDNPEWFLKTCLQFLRS